MTLYRKILSQAWKISWQNKYLWFFGLFAALLGNGGEYEILFKGLGSDGEGGAANFWQGISETGIFSKNALINIKHLLLTDTATFIIMIVIMLIMLFLFGFLIWLTIVSQVGIVSNSALAATGKTGDIKRGVLAGVKNFWAVLGLNIVSKIAIIIIFILIGLPLVFAVSSKLGSLWSNLIYLFSFVIFIPLAIAFAFVIKYAIAFVVIKDRNFGEALREGWDLFVENWLVSLEMAFILFIINFLAGLAIILAIFILAIPFLFLALLAYYAVSATAFWIITVVALLSFLLIIIFGGSILATFQTSSWTILFIELMGRGATSKLSRLMDKLS